MTVLELDRYALSADRVCGTVQKQAPGHAAGKCAIDRDVLRIEHVANIRHRRNRDGPFVDRIEHRVRVRIDNAGRNELARRIDNAGIRRSGKIFSDLGDLAVGDENVRISQRSAYGRQNSSVLDQNVTDCLSLKQNAACEYDTK